MRIIHPHPALGRQKFIGVEFRDGVAVVETLHPEVEASMLQHGFTIEQELISTGEESPFEPLPEAIEGDIKPKMSRRKNSKDEEFAIVELPDGIVIGDGESIATLQPDED